MRTVLLIYSLFFLSHFSLAQEKSKNLQAARISTQLEIDGNLNEAVWQKAQIASDFVTYRPVPGEASERKTEVKVLYDDEALYVGAILYDDPEKIRATLNNRDNLDNADLFEIVLDPYQSEINGLSFIVSAAGVQLDKKFFANGESTSWNAVWKSKVRIHEQGWTVEVEIPYSALRFAKKDEQQWGLNFGRLIMRSGELSFWNPVDPNQNGFLAQAGTLKGIFDIKPPVRLMLFPYASAYAVRDTEGNLNQSFNGGMDLKWGINDAFTLDATLIPDFGQVRSDNYVLNLTQFEVKYDENRQFFTEGTELFNKGGLFYSRRVGQSFGEVPLRTNETVDSDPKEAPLLNAIKVSGRTKSGLGVGFFNAITDSTFGVVLDTVTFEKEQVLVDPLTNFNVLVLDQNLKNRSSVTLINTNVQRSNHSDSLVYGYNGKDANVTGTQITLHDKNINYRFSAFGALSQIHSRTPGEGLANDLGYKYFLQFRKVSGKFRFNLSRNVESDDYNINDMGYLRNPNEISHNGNVEYVLNNKPHKNLNNIRFGLGANYSTLYNPRAYNNFNVNFSVNGQLSNFWNFSYNFSYRPVETHDYFEARTEGYFVRIPKSYYTNFWFGTDNRKPFRLAMSTGTFARNTWKQRDLWLNMDLTYRASNRLRLQHSFNYNIEGDDRGWVNTTYNDNDEVDQVILGTRDVETYVNTFNGSYIFTNRMGLTVRLRHYWRKVPYFEGQYFTLDTDGYLNEMPEYSGIDEEGEAVHSLNYNAFTVDLVYRWQFAPGSEMNVVWKLNTQNGDHNTGRNFMNNLSYTLNEPSQNSLSVKVLYFLDYQNVRKAMI